MKPSAVWLLLSTVMQPTWFVAPKRRSDGNGRLASHEAGRRSREVTARRGEAQSGESAHEKAVAGAGPNSQRCVQKARVPTEHPHACEIHSVSPMDKAEILAAIRRCADENGGVAVGRERFVALTGIRESDWLGRYWARWGDAVSEAGYEPNTLQAAYTDEHVLDALAELVRTQGTFPTTAEMRLHRRSNPAFPAHNVFSRFGGKADLVARLVEHLRGDPEWADVAAIAEAVGAQQPKRDEPEPEGSALLAGQVYLMKSGAHYKIGRSNSAGRRAYELAIQLPDRLDIVHIIDTDDAVGIEQYWHRRFAARRANGEWFNLTKADVAAFRRRKHFM